MALLQAASQNVINIVPKSHLGRTFRHHLPSSSQDRLEDAGRGHLHGHLLQPKVFQQPGHVVFIRIFDLPCWGFELVELCLQLLLGQATHGLAHVVCLLGEGGFG